MYFRRQSVFGVNHSNQAKASLLYEKFKNPDSIIELLGIAYEGD